MFFRRYDNIISQQASRRTDDCLDYVRARDLYLVLGVTNKDRINFDVSM